MSALEGHFCWEDCDEGPHGCVCGNDCVPIPNRCKVCGWLLSDAKAHVDATYEDHISDAPATAWEDGRGDVWTLGPDGLLWSFENVPFPREHVTKKWGPLIPIQQNSHNEGEDQ